MSEVFLREYFAYMQRYVKLGVFAKEIGIPASNLSNFIKYGAKSVSLERLIQLYHHINDTLEKIA